MGAMLNVIVLGVSILVIVEIFVIGHAAVESRKELQRVSRLLLISLSFEHPEFSILDHSLRMSGSEYGRPEFPLSMYGTDWTCIVKGELSSDKPAKIVGFNGDRLVVSSAEPGA